jgi:hypothetical protein
MERWSHGALESQNFEAGLQSNRFIAATLHSFNVIPPPLLHHSITPLPPFLQYVLLSIK